LCCWIASQIWVESGGYLRKTVAVATIAVVVVVSVTVCVISTEIVAVTCEITIGVTVLRGVLVENSLCRGRSQYAAYTVIVAVALRVAEAGRL